MAEVKTTGFWQSFVKMQAELPTLSKSATNPYFSSKYVPLETVIEVVRPILSKHGFGYTQLPTVVDGQPALRTVIAHSSSGESISDTMLLVLKTADPQGQGSAITYARRYALMSILGIVGDEDDDGNKAQDTASREAAKTITEKQQNEIVMLIERGGRTVAKYEEKFGKVKDMKASDFAARKQHLEKLVEQQG